MPVLLDMWSGSQGHSVPLHVPQEDWVMEQQQAACAARQVPQTSPGSWCPSAARSPFCSSGKVPWGWPLWASELPASGAGSADSRVWVLPWSLCPLLPRDSSTPPRCRDLALIMVIVSTASRVCPLCEFLTEDSTLPPPRPAGPRSLLESRFGLQWDWGRVAPTEETKPTGVLSARKTNIKVVTGASLLATAQQPAWCTCKWVSLPF